MLLIKKKYLYTLLIISVMFILILGIGYYKIFIYLFGNIEDEVVKYHAENFIYFSIVAVIILVIIFFSIILRSRNFYKEIDKVIEITKNSNIDLNEFLKRWGVFGNKVNELTLNLNEISHLKSLKISTFWNIIRFFIDNLSNDVLLINSEGYIVNASDDVFSAINVEKNDILKKNIVDLFENFDLVSLKNKLIADKYSVVLKGLKFVLNNKKEKVDMTFFPVHDFENNLNYFIALNYEKEIAIKEKNGFEEIIEEVAVKKGFSFGNIFKAVKKVLIK